MNLRCHTERWNRQFEILVWDLGEVWAGDKNSGRHHLHSMSPKPKPSGSQFPPAEAIHKGYLKISSLFLLLFLPTPQILLPYNYPQNLTVEKLRLPVYSKHPQ